MIHYVYSVLYAKIYNRINHFSIKRKNDFDYQFQIWKKEKQSKNLGKEPINYLLIVNEEEQKPITDKNNKNTLKRKMLEEKLEENTKAMKKMKRSKSNNK